MAVAPILPNPTKSQFSMSGLEDGPEMQNVQLDITVKPVARNLGHVQKEHMVFNLKLCKVHMAGHHQVMQFQKDFGSKVVTHVLLDTIVIKSI